MTGSCYFCGGETVNTWGMAIGRPHHVCESCEADALEAAAREQAEWRAAGRCVCCGHATVADEAAQCCDACAPA